MRIAIDHVVLAVDDPDAAVEALATELGLTPGGGGRHEALGTFNRLIWLGDAYLELVGVFDRELASRGWFGPAVIAALDRGGGLATWAIAVDDLDAALRWAPPAALTGPIDGERRRPDERVVRWRLAHPDGISPTDPFLIEHDVQGAEWTADERATRADEVHALGGRVRLVGLEVETGSVAATAGRIRKLLAATVEPAGRNAVRVRLGDHEARFVVTRPRSPAGVDLLAEVPRRTRTARVGDCEIRLRGVALTAVDTTSDGAPEGV